MVALTLPQLLACSLC